jgi:4-hydroxybenzoate polyprenyltransferase
MYHGRRVMIRILLDATQGVADAGKVESKMVHGVKTTTVLLEEGKATILTEQMVLLKSLLLCLQLWKLLRKSLRFLPQLLLNNPIQKSRREKDGSK